MIFGRGTGKDPRGSSEREQSGGEPGMGAVWGDGQAAGEGLAPGADSPFAADPAFDADKPRPGHAEAARERVGRAERQRAGEPRAGEPRARRPQAATARAKGQRPKKPRGREPLVFPSSYIAVDTETNGMGRPQEVIEIGAVAVADGVVTGRYETLVRPDALPLPRFIEGLTGITSDMLWDAPEPWEILDDFLAFLRQGPLAAHNAAFDKGVLDGLLRRNGYEPLAVPVFDTLKAARRVFPELPDHKLGTVFAHCEALSWREPPRAGRAHRALYDAEMCAYVLEVMREQGQG